VRLEHQSKHWCTRSMWSHLASTSHLVWSSAHRANQCISNSCPRSTWAMFYIHTGNNRSPMQKSCVQASRGSTTLDHPPLCGNQNKHSVGVAREQAGVDFHSIIIETCSQTCFALREHFCLPVAGTIVSDCLYWRSVRFN